MNATMTIELARLNQDGSWDLIGDFDTMDEAIRAAERNCSGAHHLDDGSVVFGASQDPASGHYEAKIGAWPNRNGGYDAILLS
ncbi:MAG TPA: hypothetical protein VKY26_05245 [Actinomycetota bacterium]|nr:hypothetical protein [Actinomycetota bacterium]